jgi:hypothetical protein
VTFQRDGSQPGRQHAAQGVLDRARLRAARNEAIGVVQVWHSCGRHQAGDDLNSPGGVAGRDAEASRIIAAVDHNACGQADPDAQWD